MADVAILSASEGNGNIFDELYREYLEDRTLVFNAQVDDNVVEDYIMWILKWNKEDKNLPVENRKKIKLFITSEGGNVFSANIMSDVIEQSKTPVVGIALDLVASAAYHIYLSCHERYAFVNSTFLQHDGEIAIQNSSKKAKDTVAFFDEGAEREKKHVLSHSSMDEKYYDDHYDDELWMYADTAKSWGIVHKIIGVDCDIDEVF
jgi:ATP-dependent Clp protease protease subunit